MGLKKFVFKDTEYELHASCRCDGVAESQMKFWPALIYTLEDAKKQGQLMGLLDLGIESLLCTDQAISEVLFLSENTLLERQ